MRVRIIPQGKGVNWYVVDKMIGPDKLAPVGIKVPRGEAREPLQALLEQADTLERRHRQRILP